MYQPTMFQDSYNFTVLLLRKNEVHPYDSLYFDKGSNGFIAALKALTLSDPYKCTLLPTSNHMHLDIEINKGCRDLVKYIAREESNNPYIPFAQQAVAALAKYDQHLEQEKISETIIDTLKKEDSTKKLN